MEFGLAKKIAAWAHANREPNKQEDWIQFCMKRLRTLKTFKIFKSEIKNFKTYSGWCAFKGLSNGTTLMQIQSGRTVPLSLVPNKLFTCVSIKRAKDTLITKKEVRRYFKNYYCRGLHSMIVQFVVLFWRGFISVKIPEWYVNKSASRLYCLFLLFNIINGVAT